jgi:hypothetical protein
VGPRAGNWNLRLKRGPLRRETPKGKATIMGPEHGSLGPTPCPCSPEWVEGDFSEVCIQYRA